MYRNNVPLGVIHQRGNGGGPRDSGASGLNSRGCVVFLIGTDCGGLRTW